ncbi:MAG: hypothetical protein NVS4B2_10820 [Chloroflexota bacterium]
MSQGDTTVARHIVIVDDEETILQILCDVLEMEGFDVACLDHPRLVDTHVAGTAANLFLIDLMLPTMTGIELASKLRRDGHDSTPMIAISASASMRRAATQSGLFHATIAKPFDLDRVVETVQQYVA